MEFPSLVPRRQIRALVITPCWCELRAAERQHAPPEGRDSPGERKKRFPPLQAQEEHVWEVGRGVPALAAHPRCQQARVRRGHVAASHLLPPAKTRCVWNSCNRGVGNSKIPLENGVRGRFLCLTPCGPGVLPGCLLGSFFYLFPSMLSSLCSHLALQCVGRRRL